MEQNFKYFAFISYKREDEKWARWLQNKLETCKLPSSLPTEDGKEYPKTLRPCFRDKADLGETGDLTKILHDKLQKSQYLIVVCSPRSAKSEWVNEEIKAFQAMGRADKIIPFIIEGTPNLLKLDTHCYPPKLNDNILGISVPELGKEKSAVKTIAAMLHIDFDVLWNRHRERVLKRRIKIAVFSMIIIALLGSIFFAQAENLRKTNKELTETRDSLQKTAESLQKTTDSLQITNYELKKNKELIENQNKEITEANDQLRNKTQELQKSNIKLDNKNQELEDKNNLIEKQKAKIVEEYQRAEKLINAFYFYDGKFALAHKNNEFYFIDKKGDEVEKLGRWKHVEHFDFVSNSGFAKVIDDKDLVYWLDTIGNKYKYSNNINTIDNTIQALDLSNQGLVELSEKTWNFTNLKVLDISNNRLINLPSGIEKLTNLTVLNISFNQLTNLPPGVVKFSDLSVLDLSANYFTSVPSEVWNFINLTKLDLGHNNITSLPSNIGNLKNLAYLDLSSNEELENLPSEVWTLTKLSQLYLIRNKFTAIPPDISKLVNLKELYLSRNKLTSLPPEIWELSNLTHLGLSNTDIKNLSHRIEKLQKLQYLFLSNTNITNLSSNLEKLSNLRYIKYDNTPLDEASKAMADKINSAERQ